MLMTLRKFLWLPAVAIIVLAGFALAQTQKTTATAPKVTSAKIDVKAALAPRTLGNPKAPVKMDEYASLSCTHCAAFSNETFDKFKELYIDTGKVFYTYHDFPLNAPALQASMVARCLPEEHYFQFVKFLFQTQEKWAFNAHYSDSLRQNSKLLGLDDATFDACINNEKLKQGLIEQIQEASKEKGPHIQSTPTFIIDNGAETISGAMPLSKFQSLIDPLVAAKGGKTK
jgi:protein-disulfide isomerase